MRWSRLSLALACGAVLGCEAPGLSPQQREVEEQFLEDRLTEWTTALNNRATENLAGIYENSPGLTVVWADGRRALGHEEQQQAIQDLYNTAEQLNFVTQSPVIDVLTSSVAVVTFRHSMDIRFFDTRRQLSSGYGTLVFVKDEADDVWRIRTQLISITPDDG